MSGEVKLTNDQKAELTVILRNGFGPQIKQYMVVGELNTFDKIMDRMEQMEALHQPQTGTTAAIEAKVDAQHQTLTELIGAMGEVRQWQVKNTSSQQPQSAVGVKRAEADISSAKPKQSRQQGETDENTQEVGSSVARGQGCYYCGKMGHIAWECQKKMADLRSGKLRRRSVPNSFKPRGGGEPIVCFMCKGIGHMWRDCPEVASKVQAVLAQQTALQAMMAPIQGTCQICFSTLHTAQTCPHRQTQQM